MQDNSKNNKRKSLNGDLTASVILFPLAALSFLYIAAIMLSFVGDSMTILANAIALPIIAIVMLVITIFIIMRKKSTFRAVNVFAVLAIILSLGIAGFASAERISDQAKILDDELYDSCVASWEYDKELGDDMNGGVSLYAKYKYQKNGESLNSYQEVIEKCEAESTRDASSTEIIAIVVQNIIFAIIPSFTAVLIWLYFKQNDEAHEILNQ